MKAIVIMIVMLLSCNDNGKKNAILKPLDNVNSEKIKGLKLDYVNLYMTSTTRVSPKKFDSTFGLMKKQKVIENDNQIKSFSEFLNETISSNKKTESINVRLKITVIYEDNKEEVYYTGLNKILIEEVSFLLTDDFKNFLIKITESKVSRSN
ncbi:hypothetical protein [uncultured Psychroserpens sp.]|uniref:hypothetical protein n=1 Tax=uncultured Psychroserpens sp. TaxID=255436 RepID=UPI002630E375|nr:hypothetical protein [uncultured Psychroserpens sp.]